MLGVRQRRHVALRHEAFFVSRQNRLCRRVFFNRLWNNVYDRWITSNFPCKWHGKASTTSGWKSSPAKIFHWNSSGERRLKFIASGSKKTNAKQREHRLAQRRQRRQHSDHKHVQRHRQNTTLLHCKPDWLQAKPMKRKNTNFGLRKATRISGNVWSLQSKLSWA